MAIEYRWAENQMDRLPELAADLVRRRVAVIVTTGGPASALAAKAATTTIPIVFAVAEDPVRLGLVASLARPGGNLTGISFFNTELAAKRLELLRELVPAATRVAVLVNPASPANTETTLRDVEAAARSIGLQIQIFNASTSREIDAVFATFARERPDALFVGGDGFFTNRRVQMSLQAMRHAVAATYGSRDFAEVGGLMSYGTNIPDAYHQIGAYTGRSPGLEARRPASGPGDQFETDHAAFERLRGAGLDVLLSPARPRRRGGVSVGAPPPASLPLDLGRHHPALRYAEVDVTDVAYGASLTDIARLSALVYCRPHPDMGADSGGLACGAGVEVRAGHQHPGCQVARARGVTLANRPRRRGDRMKRRDFIALGSAAAVAGPAVASAQQAQIPVVGFLRVTSAADATNLVSAFRQGLV